MFALPYVFSQSGFLVGSFYLILFMFVFIKINKDYAVVIGEHSGKYRFASYAKEHLGIIGFWTSIMAVVVGLLLTLTVYVILASSFWSLISPIGNGVSNYVFWAISSIAIATSLKSLLNLNTFISAAMVAIIVFIFFLGLGHGAPTAPIELNWPKLLFPYGAVLFAMYGRAAIAPLEDYYESAKLDWKKSGLPITLGTAIPAVLFFLFAAGVAGISPAGVTTDAVSGIVNGTILPLPILGVLGLLTIWTSYVVIGTEIKDILANDLKLRGPLALLLVAVIPVALYTLGIGNFITLVSIIGAIFLAVECILVILMRSKLKKGLSLWDKLIILMLVAGALHTALIVF